MASSPSRYPFESPLTRRSLLAGAAGGAAILAAGRLPAWARPVASAAGLRQPDSLPFPNKPAGAASMPDIEHIVVVMMENHSFDNVLGMVPHQVPGRGAVDGLQVRGGRVVNSNPDASGNPVVAQHATSPCQLSGEPSQSWNASHGAWDNGLNDGFVKASAPIAMSYWDKRDLPFTYSLVEHFPLGDRHFSSLLGQTWPNRSYLFAGTSTGMVNDIIAPTPPPNGTIWDRLDAHHINWRIYYQTPSYPSFELVPGADTPARAPRIKHFNQFLSDAAAGKLPQFTFLDPNYETTSEENPQDIQLGERYLAQVVSAVTRAPTWKHTALFITYDEHGGYYDHVPPPAAIPPDSIAPVLTSNDVPGAFDRYGFRVPMIVVSPWAKPRYVSHRLTDHTSVLAFIERKWNLPAMTLRDANAQPLTDYFNFARKPAFLKAPKLAAAPKLGPGLAACHASGLNPPLTG